jgi:hypothetical protein
MVEIIAMIDIIMAVAGFAVYLAGVAWFCFEEARERRPGFSEFPAGASLRPSTNPTNKSSASISVIRVIHVLSTINFQDDIPARCDP